ncbi:hypothetical protein XENOCAPTIV_015425 [Xenoophorus captivus]|uniref:Uncharacterized protein n=1 Tax=Xenoophorus captivus TaxID=1517983 RepID=A0ABV0RQV4_9TELE
MLSPAPDDSERVPEPIVPPTWAIGTVSWEIEEQVNRALRTEPDPGIGPKNRTLVPASVRARVIQRFHTDSHILTTDFRHKCSVSLPSSVHTWGNWSRLITL